MQIDKIKNLIELFFKKHSQKKRDDIFLQSLKNIENSFTWDEVFQNILKLSRELKKFVNKGDRCMIISENRPEWFIADHSIMLIGGISVPTYTTYLEQDYEYIIDDCSPCVIIVSNSTQFNKIRNLIKKKNFVKKIISFEKLNIDDKNYINFENVAKLNSKFKDYPKIDIKREEAACIIYTSGTQGNPKGVILSHGGILNNCECAVDLLKPILSENTRFLTWLPLSHSYEHTVQFVQVSVGGKIFYAESIDKLIPNMIVCKPQIMTAVPRFYKNLYLKINNTFSKSRGFKKTLINKMLELGSKKFKKRKLTMYEKIINFFLDLLIRKKIKSQFGGSLKTFVSGGGALDPNVGNFLNSIGLPTLQGYGLTETSPVVSCNPINDIRIDTVGPPFKNNKVKIAEDGEILVKGENVMLGYWNNDVDTQNVIRHGWLHTGDIGFIEDGYLRITDRKKDILITPGGENISPIKIENILLNSDLFEQVIVYGDNKPYLVALLVLNNEKNINNKEEINKELEKLNKNLNKIEKIKKYLVVNQKFTIDNGLMTPTLKLKRYKIVNKFKKELENLY